MAFAHSLADTSSENASAAAFSASCYHIREDVRILSVIVAIGGLCQVQGQVFLAHLMKRTDHATLQQAPEGFQVVRVNAPSHILFLRMVHGLVRLMRKQAVDVFVACVLIGRNHRSQSRRRARSPCLSRTCAG